MQSLLENQQVKLSKEDEAELRLLCAELEYRRQVNPLAFFKHLTQQSLFHRDPSKDKNLFGGNRELAYGTLVKMADGASQLIETLKIGDYVLAWDGKKSIPTKIIDIPYDDYSETIKVITSSGIEIEASANHCFPIKYTSNAKKYVKKMTLEEAGSKKYHLKKFIFGGVQWYTNNDKLPFSGVLLGLFLGDGSYGNSPSAGYARPNFTNKVLYIRNLFCRELLKTYPNLRCQARPSDETRLYVSLLGATKGKNPFINELRNLGLTVKSDKKFIPNVFKYSTPFSRRGIIRGLILTDGGVDRYKTSIYSNSLRLLRDVEEIIISLGGRSKIYIDGLPDNSNQKTTYKLQFSNEFIFLMDIGDLMHKTPKNRLTRDPRRDDLLIKNVFKTGVKKCRCIKVEHPSHTFVLANGIVTYNSGKTEEIAEYIITKGLERKMRIWACAETFSDSVNIQQRKIWEKLPKNKIKYGRYDEINGFSNRKIKLTNGTLIILKSYDQGVASFAQDDVDIIWNDEEPPYDIYKEERMRLIDRNGEMLISMTSTQGVTDLIADIFEDHTVIESRYAEHVNETLPVIAEKNGIKFYMLWNTDNPHIDQNRLRHEIKLMTRDEIKSRVYGIPVNLSGKIYLMFSKNVHVMPFELCPFKDITLYHVLDPHDRKPFAMQWWVVHKTGTAYCIDEYPNRNFNEMISDDKTYNEYVNIIQEKEDALFSIYGQKVYKRIIDPNFGNKTIKLAERTDAKAHTTPKEELKKRGLKFQDGIDCLEAGHLKVREKLYYEMKDGEIVVQPACIIADTCPNTARHLSRYSRKDIMTPDGDVKNNAKPREKYKDFSDLTRYFFMHNPKYITGVVKQIPEAPRLY